MKAGRSLMELAAEVKRQDRAKVDYLADTAALSMSEDGSVLRVQNGDVQEFEVTDYCHGQIGARLGIPKKYYERMREDAPHLLKDNVDHWFASNRETRMIRTLDGRARAFLSDRYRQLDHRPMIETVFPALRDLNVEIKSSEITDTRLYIQAVSPHLKTEVKPGDEVRAGLTISNSEVGAGSVKVEFLVYRLVCTNGLIVPKRIGEGIHQYHVGRKHDPVFSNGLSRYFSNETRRADDRVFWSKVGDVVRGALSGERFDSVVGSLRESTERRIEGDLVKVVEVARERLNLTEGERGSVLNHLIAGGDLSQYGLSNAITRSAEDSASYDRAVELERIGGQVIDLHPRDWNAISKAS